MIFILLVHVQNMFSHIAFILSTPVKWCKAVQINHLFNVASKLLSTP